MAGHLYFANCAQHERTEAENKEVSENRRAERNERGKRRETESERERERIERKGLRGNWRERRETLPS